MGTLAYQLSRDELLQSLKTSENGIISDRIPTLRKEAGDNSIPERKISFYQKYIRPVVNLMIIILFLAACLQIWFYYAYQEGSLLGPSVVLVILSINVIIGMRQQYKAEKTIEALKRLSSFKATVKRDGKEKIIEANELLPGDLLLLKQGDYISADARLIEVNELSVDESNLTGEVQPVYKSTGVLERENLQLQEQNNMVFSSTYVVQGNGQAIVTHIGVQTEIGKISKSIATQEKREIPLQNKMNYLAKSLGLSVLGVLVILFVIQILRNGTGNLINEIIWLVSLAVAAIPFNFPLITTIILLTGVLKLAKKQAIIRNLNAVETMGRLNVICSDKTGTITAHQMTVKRIHFDDRDYRVSGIGYEPEGKIFLNETEFKVFDEVYLWNMLKNGIINNNAHLSEEIVKIRKGTKKIVNVIGVPTEGALITLAKKAGINDELERENYALLKEYTFTSSRKRMTKVVQRDGINTVYTKGAPEILLDLCTHFIQNNEIIPITPKEKGKILGIAKKYALDGLRTLGFAHKKIAQFDPILKAAEVENNLIFSGIVGILDPPRKGVKRSIEICKSAGVDVKMITGDYPITAASIGKQINLFSDGDRMASGSEIQDMTDEEIEQTQIFARVTPDDKLKIIQALQNRKKIVAMTGDGVNDAMALENADVGISMGLRGTDVAKNASDMVLTDDSFNTIERALYHGRGLFNNIRSNIIFLLASNLVELILLSVMYIVFDYRAFNSFQLILLYGTIHFFPPLGLMFDKYDESIMRNPPKGPKEKLINPSYRKLLFIQMISIFIVLFGIWLSLLNDIIMVNDVNMQEIIALNPFSGELRSGYLNDGTFINFLDGQNPELLVIFKGRTMCFIILLLSETWIALESRSNKISIFKSKINILLYIFLLGVLALMFFLLHYNLAQIYIGFLNLSRNDWIICLSASLIPLVITEIYKLTQ